MDFFQVPVLDVPLGDGLFETGDGQVQLLVAAALLGQLPVVVRHFRGQGLVLLADLLDLGLAFRDQLLQFA